MLHGGRRKHVLRVVALKPLNHPHRHLPDEIRIFAKRLFRAAPTGVPIQIHVRRPDGKADAHALVLLDVDPSFIPFDGAHLAQHLGVPRLAQANRLREGGRRDAPAADPAQTVQPLGEIGENLDSQPRDGRLDLPQHGDLLLRGQPGNQIVHSPLERQIGVAERLGGGQRLDHAGGQKYRENDNR